MFEHAVLAIDVRAPVSLARCAPDLGRLGIEKLTLLNVIRSGYGEPPIPGHVEDHEEALETQADRLREKGFEVDTRVLRASDVAEAIVEVASSADLLVAGTRTRNFLAEFFLGSVVRKVLHETTVPVLLEWVDASDDADEAEPMLASTDRLGRVLLATDLTHGSIAAHEAAVTLGGRGAVVDCAHVVSRDDSERYPEWETMVTAVLESLLDRVEKAGGKPGQILIANGEPVPTLLELAVEQATTLIVVGKRGRNWPESMLGSTALKLTQRAGIPVLLAPRTRDGQ